MTTKKFDPNNFKIEDLFEAKERSVSNLPDYLSRKRSRLHSDSSPLSDRFGSKV